MATKNKTPTKKPDSKKFDDEDAEGQEGTEDDDSDDEGDSQEANQRINAIVTNRVKREMKAVNQQLTAMMAKLESLASPKGKESDGEDDEDTDEETPKKIKAEPDPKLARKMQKLENELKEEREARKKAEIAQKDEQAKAARQEMVGQFEAALTEHGVTDPKLRRAALMSLEADGYMVRDEESGKIKFKGADKYGMETLFDPKAGVKQWVLSEGKSFIPAVDAGGSGTGGARQGVGNSSFTKGEYGKLSPQQKAAIELERASAGLPPLE